jgi:hypothetical protein
MLVLIFALGTIMTTGGARPASVTAVVTLDGREIHRIDLQNVSEPYEFLVESDPDHYNLLRVEEGRIRVLEASCPDQIDVKQGWISRSHQSIICLPNRLVIRILPGSDAPDSEIDGIAF